MFRFLSQTLPLRRSLTSQPPRRLRSTFSGDDCLIEIDLSPSSSESNNESDALMLKKLDDVVQRLIVQKATPYWLPFLPGSSFWVPPRSGGGDGGGGPLMFADLVGKLSDNLPDDESISFSASDFRWPSSRYYLAQRSESEEAETSAEIETEAKKEALSDSPNTHLSEDEEG